MPCAVTDLYIHIFFFKIKTNVLIDKIKVSLSFIGDETDDILMHININD